METINPICGSRGIKAAKPIEIGEKVELEMLDDLSKTSKLLESAKSAISEVQEILKSLSPGALKIYIAAYKEVQVLELSSSAKVLKTLERTIETIKSKPEREQAKLFGDLTKVKKALTLLTDPMEEVARLSQNLSKDGASVYLDAAAAAKEEIPTKRIIETLEATILRMTEKIHVQKLDLQIDLGKSDEIEGRIAEICTPEEEIPLVPLVVSNPTDADHVVTPELPKLPLFVWSLFGGSGYVKRALGEDAPEILADKERGVLIDAGGSGRFNLSDKLSLQMDYRFRSPYDVEGKDRVVLNEDNGKLTLARKGASFDILGQAGGRYYRSNYPSKSNPTVKVGSELINFVYRFTPDLSLNIFETLDIGKGSSEFQGPQRTIIQGKLQPSVTYKIGEVFLTGGGILGYDNFADGIFGGPLVGAAYQKGSHDASTLVSYERSAKTNQARAALNYFYGKTVGLFADYQFSDAPGAAKHRVGIGADARFYLWKDLFVEPFLGGIFGRQDDRTVLGAKGGLFFGYGTLAPQQMIPTRPNSVDSNSFLGGF